MVTRFLVRNRERCKYHFYNYHLLIPLQKYILDYAAAILGRKNFKKQPSAIEGPTIAPKGMYIKSYIKGMYIKSRKIPKRQNLYNVYF